jgi:AraC-like DNA-binding protein
VTTLEKVSAQARAIDLAGVHIAELTRIPAHAVRTPRPVRDHDPELIALVLALSGRLVVAQAGREAVLPAGDMALYTRARPFQIRIDDETDCPRLLRMQTPRSLVAVLFPDLDAALATPLSGRRGVGALLRQFLTHVVSESASYRPGDLPRLGNVAVDLLAATLAHEVGASLDASPQQQSLLPRIMAFIRQHLRDPRLSPSSIAAAHHISVSYLHRLFQSHDTTVWAWIRSQRLDRARRDLTDPHLRELPVHRIAARWGYTDHATFTRAFRASYGVPPREYRHTVLTMGSGADRGDHSCPSGAVGAAPTLRADGSRRPCARRSGSR